MQAKSKCSTRITIRHRCNKTKHQWPHQIGMEESEIKTQEQVPIQSTKCFSNAPSTALRSVLCLSTRTRTFQRGEGIQHHQGQKPNTSKTSATATYVPKLEDCKCEDASVTTHSRFRQCRNTHNNCIATERIRRFSEVVSSELSYIGLYFLQAHAHTKEWYAPANTIYSTKPQLQSKGMTSYQSSSS